MRGPALTAPMNYPMSSQPSPQEQPWPDLERWWVAMAARLGVQERGRGFFQNAPIHFSPGDCSKTPA